MVTYPQGLAAIIVNQFPFKLVFVSINIYNQNSYIILRLTYSP